MYDEFKTVLSKNKLLTKNMVLKHPKSTLALSFLHILKWNKVRKIQAHKDPV